MSTFLKLFESGLEVWLCERAGGALAAAEGEEEEEELADGAGCELLRCGLAWGCSLAAGALALAGCALAAAIRGAGSAGAVFEGGRGG